MVENSQKKPKSIVCPDKKDQNLNPKIDKKTVQHLRTIMIKALQTLLNHCQVMHQRANKTETMLKQ